ncbi:MAG: hypothetical protein ACD_79C00965G0002 [uncultured bacterium]|nr:MAG: hypothetical protein ACD_79C00965G0002 [uncultured bacterium]
MENWWLKSFDEINKIISTDFDKGLSSQEIITRRQKYGFNQLKEKDKISPFVIFIEQFKSFIVWVLIAASLVSGILKEWVDAIAIFIIVIINAILGFVQEYKAEKSLEALKKLSSPNSKVIRDGELRIIPSSEIVPGDILELEAGDNIPADSRIYWLSTNFSTLEASLTGESTPILKTSDTLNEQTVPLADRKNMVYLGTSVASGKAKAIALQTGMSTELGKIAGMIQDIPQESTPLQKKLEEFGKMLVYLCLFLVGIVFILEFLRGGKFVDVFLTSVSLAVAAIPEGLPAVVTIALALGVQRMVKRNVIIRKLPSVETLGCSTVICSDKTGTLTKNEMTVKSVYTNSQLVKVTGIGYEPQGEFELNGKIINPLEFPEMKKTLTYAVLCNGAKLASKDNSYKIIGDPTEGSLLTLSAKAGIQKEKSEKEFSFIDEIPFDSERKKMTVIRNEKNRIIAIVKGAPDIMLSDCKFIEKNNQILKLNDEDINNILQANNDMANAALRVLALGYKVMDNYEKGQKAHEVEKDLIFLSLIAMIDPPREEVKKAVQSCKTAGIRTVMITGDHKNTAVAIAKELGFFSGNSMALTGSELDKISAEEFESNIHRIPVYARVSPEHKVRIVKAWRKKNEIVAMTGDGVNDAPAVKEADIGVAMGITGTDVTKEVSDMVVADDNFASIVSAVEEGRGIYDNIKKFIHYLLSCNVGEIFVMFIASLIGLPIPMFPIQILWVNLITDGFPALALGVDPIDKNIMNRPPRPANESVITKERAILLSIQGAFIAMCALGAFCFVLYIEKESIERARTVCFIVLAVSQLFHAYNCRSITASIFKIGFFTNKKLILATGISFILQIPIVYIGFFQGIFKTVDLNIMDWILIVLVSSFPLFIMELFKITNKKFLMKVN